LYPTAGGEPERRDDRLAEGTLPRNVEDEGGAAARGVIQAEVPAMRLQDLARDREP